MRPEVRSLRRAMSNSSQYVSLCKHSNFWICAKESSVPMEEMMLSVILRFSGLKRVSLFPQAKKAVSVKSNSPNSVVGRAMSFLKVVVRTVI